MARTDWFTYCRSFARRQNSKRKAVAQSPRKSRGFQFESLERRMLLAADVFANKLDYAPGETAHIFASDFAVGETVQFQVLHNDGTPNTGGGHEPWQVTDGVRGDFNNDGIMDGDLDGVADGNIQTTWYVNPDDSLDSAFDLTALGLSSGLSAFTTFTDGNPAVDVQQWENLTAQWANGQANANQAKYLEGDVVPYWMEAENLTVGTTYGVRINLDYYQSTTDAGGFLYLDTYNDSITGVPQNSDDGTGGPLPALSSDNTFTFNDPLYANPGLTFAVYNANVISVAYSTSANGLNRYADVRFTPVAANENDGEATVNIYWGQRLSLPNEVITSANPDANSKGASGFTGGSLQTKVEGTGVAGTTWITPSNAVQLMPGVVVQGSISGYKWNDIDGQGDKDVSEPGLAGWTIELYKDDGDNVFDAGDVLVDTEVTADGQTDANGDGVVNSLDLGFYKYAPVLRGTYFVREVQQAGWSQTYPTDNVNGPLTVSETTSSYTNINFGNRQQGRILVEKQTNPDGSVETFEFDPSYTTNFSLSDNGQNNSGLLAPGSYTVEELAKAGWDLTNIEIVSGDTDNGSTIGGDSDFDAGDKTATIDLDAGEVITVRFTNTQRGRILVEKQTNPDGSVETFEFDPSYTTNFSLSDNGQNNSGLLAPGSYTVEELAKAGWDLTNIEIVSGDTDNGSTIGGDSDFDAGDKTATIDLDAGEVITVRFTNTQRGRILVEKQTNPDGSVETFEFDPSYSANFSLSDNGQNNSGLLAPGSYTVEELAKAGWDLTNIEIVSGDTDNGSTIGGDSDFDAGDKTATIDLDAGEVITVRFTNTQRGRILVEKQTNPDGSVETFEFDPSYAANFSLSDNGQNNSGLLAPGSYTVEELAKAGWDLTNIEIVSGDTDNGSTIGGDSDFDAGDKTATIDLDAGEVITVRFTNTQRGRILVEKQTNPDGSVETFEFDPSYAANFSLSDNGQNNSGLLAPGSYTVEELAKAGWDLTNIEIVSGDTDNGSTIGGDSDFDAGDKTATIDLDAGEVITVRFTNTQRGRILVEKQTNPDGSVETFEFDPSYAANFSLSDNGQNNSGLLAPASYTVEELAKAGWDLTNIEIVSGDTDNGSTIGGDSDFDAGDKTATIDLDAGEVITVRFTNTQRGRILVEKQTNPDGSVETFEFDPSYAANFSLSDNGQNNSGLLAPGSYTVEELAKAGWDLTNIEIVSGDTDNGSTIGGDSDFDAGDKTATIDLDAGEVITVRFTNTQRGRILVEKQTNPDGSVETFEFDPSYAANFSLSDNGQNNSGLLAPGSYTVEELAKAGWDLTNIEIVSGDTDNGSTIGGDSDFDAGDKTATIDLDAGEVITVRFTNTQRGRILVEKQTNPDGSVETFEFDPSYAANFSLSDNGQNNSGLLAPASYTVEELAKAGWDLTNIEIVSGDTDNGSTIGGDSDFDAGDKTATIDLDAGEVITVRFTNTQRGRILVEKQTNPDGSVETFEFDPSYAANFSLSDNGQNNSGLLAPASYTVEELAKAGWDLTNIEIVSGDTDNGSTIGGDSDFDAGDKTATIDLDAGEVITVRFTNTQRGRILVEKQTNPDGSVETFEFDPSYAANFSLSDNGQNNSGLLAPASYTVEELAKAGWDLTNIEIVSGDTDNGSTIGGDSDFDAGDKTATIDLDAGEVITVRFTNTQRGRILVEKQTNPDGSVETFEFDPSYAANFSLSDNGQNNSGLLAPASYTVEELAKAGWDLTNIEIVSGDTDNGSTIGGDSDFDAGDKTATIDLDAGEVITVRFTNTKKSDVIVIGPDKGNTSVPIVKIVDRQSGAILSQFYAFESNFLGGVRIATGDMNGDGIDEIIVASGQGRVGEVRVFTQAGVELTQFRTVPYGTKYAGGIEVAVGDVNGDGKNDIVTTLSNGRAEVRVFYNNYNPALPLLDPIANTPNKQFYLYSSSFLGGADVIVADMGTFVNGTTVNATTPDGKGEIVIGNGPGMRSTIYVYDISGTPTVVDTILPLSNSFKGGITLSAARVNADAIPDLIVASGNQGGSTIEIWNGLTNDLNDLRLSAFATFGDSSTKNAPVHATALDTNGDGIADIIAVVQGTNGTSNQIRSFSTGGTSLGTLGGFVGPWNIASLSKVDSNLKPPMQAVSAVDQAFASLIEESLSGKKAKKKKK